MAKQRLYSVNSVLYFAASLITIQGQPANQNRFLKWNVLHVLMRVQLCWINNVYCGLDQWHIPLTTLYMFLQM